MSVHSAPTGRSDDAARSSGDLASAAVVTVVYFAFMLTIGYSPRLFTAPLYAGSAISVGLACGIAMTVFIVIFCVWYTHGRNRREISVE
jgi:uncharacterized membrane protein (DUF485 family)